MRKITINGIEINVPEGANVSVIDGQVIVGDNAITHQSCTIDGNNVTIASADVAFNIKVVGGDVKIEGNVKGDVRLEKGTIHIAGSIGRDAIIEKEGDINCKQVGRNAQAGGDVTCEGVGNNVQAGGNVTCNNVGNNVMASNVECGNVMGKIQAMSVTKKS